MKIVKTLPLGKGGSLVDYLSTNRKEFDRVLIAHQFTNANAACIGLFRYDQKDTFIKTFRFASTKASRTIFMHIMANLLAKTENFEYFNSLLAYDGTPCPVTLKYRLDIDSHGGPEYNSVLVAIDCLTSSQTSNSPHNHSGMSVRGNSKPEFPPISQEKWLSETGMQQTQRLNSLGILARGVAHEINNPLTGLMNYASILEDEVENPQLRKFARSLREEGVRVSDIVTNLLTFARSDSGSRQQIHIFKIIEKAAMLINQSLLTDHIHLDTREVDQKTQIFCLVQDIQHVLLNIITNSWQAIIRKNVNIGPRRRISIKTSTIIHDSLEYARISIKDEGDGIASADLANVFDPFFSNQPRSERTGLGLSVSYGIVRDHGGIIKIDSVEGDFTVVTIDLPVNPKSATSSA